MRRLLAIGTMVLGVVGMLVCAVAAGLGWWAAARAVDRIDRVAARLGPGLSEADERLARVEARVNGVCSELNEIRGAAESIAKENPELPRVRAEIERLLDRLVPALDRANVIAESLRSVAAGLRTAANIVSQLTDQSREGDRAKEGDRAGNAADTIDRAAEALGSLPARVEALKTSKAVVLTRELAELARDAAAGSERLNEGLASARKAITATGERMGHWRGQVVFWANFAATVNTLLWLWGGLGQLCLIDWGRRRISNRVRATA